MARLTFLERQQEIAARSRMDLNVVDQATLIRRWINLAEEKIWSRYDWPFALSREVVQTITDKTAGTVSISAGGQIVTGVSTAFADGDAGKFIQFSSSNDWYKISTVAGTTSLTIEAPYVGTSALSGGTYTIRKIFYSLSSSVEKVLDVRQMVTPQKLTLIPFRTFDIFDATPQTAQAPAAYIPFGLDSNNNWTFSVWPYPSEILNLEFRTKIKRAALSADADISKIPEKWENVVLDGTLALAYEYNRKDPSDRSGYFKMQEFEAGIRQMIEDAEPNSDEHIVMMNRDVPNIRPSDQGRLPETI